MTRRISTSLFLCAHARARCQHEHGRLVGGVGRFVEPEGWITLAVSGGVRKRGTVTSVHLFTSESGYCMTTDLTPQFIYFDLGNVLLTFDAQIACRQMADLTVLPRSASATSCWQPAASGAMNGRGQQPRVLRRILCRVPHAAGLRRIALRQQRDVCGQYPGHSHRGPLWAARYRLGFYPIRAKRIGTMWGNGRYRVIRDLFEVQVLSHHERCCKPEPAIYQRAVELAGVEPHRISCGRQAGECRRCAASRVGRGVVSRSTSLG